MNADEVIKKVLTVAKGQIGVRERSANWGKEVAAYLASCGIALPAPWCAAFVQWAMRGAGPAGNVWNPPNPAYCPSIHAWARQEGLLHAKPAVGDVFLYVENGWALHTGFVTAVTHGGARFSTVEGNTNLAGSSEGDGVYERSRGVTASYVFIRWADKLRQSVAPPTFDLIVNGEKIASMPVKNGRSYIALRDWAKFLGKEIIWDQERQRPRIGGRLLAPEIELMLRDGVSYAQINQVLQGSGLSYGVDLGARAVVACGQVIAE